MPPLILRLNVSGHPVGWMPWKEAVLLYARDVLADDHSAAPFDEVAGFLDDCSEAAGRLAGLGVEVDVVESIDAHTVRSEFVYVIAVGNGSRPNLLCGPVPGWTGAAIVKSFVLAGPPADLRAAQADALW